MPISPSSAPPTNDTDRLLQLNNASKQLASIILHCKQTPTGVIGRDRIINNAFGVVASIVNFDQILNHGNDSEKKLALEVQEKISELLQLAEAEQKAQRATLPCTKDGMLQLIKDNNAKVLNTFRDEYVGANRNELMGYAFRVAAAGGKIDCLRSLSKYRCNYFLIPGEATNKIALQFAVENGHTKAIECLLLAVNSDDYFCSYRQLLHGIKGRRAIDLIANFADEDKKAEMLRTVSTLLNNNDSHTYTAKDEEIAEVRSILSLANSDVQNTQHRAPR